MLLPISANFKELVLSLADVEGGSLLGELQDVIELVLEGGLDDPEPVGVVGLIHLVPLEDQGELVFGGCVSCWLLFSPM